jgi:hypothetical protein
MQPQDNRIIIEFFVDAVQLGHRSEIEGRPVFEDREFVRILIAGDARTEVVKEVTAEVRAKYAQAYEHWQRTREPLHEGTPLGMARASPGAGARAECPQRVHGRAPGGSGRCRPGPHRHGRQRARRQGQGLLGAGLVPGFGVCIR